MAKSLEKNRGLHKLYLGIIYLTAIANNMIENSGAESLARAFSMNDAIEVLHMGRLKFNARK